MMLRCVRSMMLEQTWNLKKGYVKPLHFSTSKSSKTFFFTAKNKSDYHYSILGELLPMTHDHTKMIKAVDKHFREAVYRFDDIDQVASALCLKLDGMYSNLNLSFQLWTRHENLDYISVISMGTPAMKCITKDFEAVVLDFDTEPYKSPSNLSFKSALIPITQTQYLIFATDPSLLSKIIPKPNVSLSSIFELSKHIGEAIERESKPPSESKGEVSLLVMALHDYTVTSETTFYGLENYDVQIEAILSTIPLTYDRFSIKLILSELLMNAYKYGNNVDRRLPIKVICGISDDELVLEVLDTGIRLEDIPIKTVITSEDLLEENGRGLYLVNAFSDSLTIDNNSVVSRIKCKKQNAETIRRNPCSEV